MKLLFAFFTKQTTLSYGYYSFKDLHIVEVIPKKLLSQQNEEVKVKYKTIVIEDVLAQDENSVAAEAKKRAKGVPWEADSTYITL